jgi:hypothetical protein
MPRYSKKNQISDQTREEALQVARATQRPAQTKEQTRLIAQGIQKGIDLYKKQQKAKARELDKKLKSVTAMNKTQTDHEEDNPSPHEVKNSKLPWLLLLFSWTGFIVYLMLKELAIF